MIPIISLLLILGTSLIVTRVASVALEHTGLGRDAARFQARSAFTGVGFTTVEAEDIVGHPVRRRIVMWLMLVGNVGIVSAMAAVLVSAIDLRSQEGVGLLVTVLVGGLAFIWALGVSRHVDRAMCRGIRWALQRWTSLDSRDYARLLHLRDDYGVARVRVRAGDWMAGRTLADAGLVDEGLLVLGVECPGGHFIGAPPVDVEIGIDDEILVYGPAGRVAGFEARDYGDRGDRAHAEAIDEHIGRRDEERRQAGR